MESSEKYHGRKDFAQIFGVYPDDKYKKASARNIAQVIAVEGGEADMRSWTMRTGRSTRRWRQARGEADWMTAMHTRYARPGDRRTGGS